MKNNIKVAILDSGINAEHKLFSGRKIKGGSFDNEGCFHMGDFHDVNGHGTACASVILKECDDIELYIYRILDRCSMTNLNILERALTFLIESDIKIINLSLSVIDKAKTGDLMRICEQLNINGKIVVCALSNGRNKSYPACFNNTIGIQGFVLEHPEAYWFSRKKKVQTIIDDEPFLHAGLYQEYSYYGKCNSFAAAKMTGYIASVYSGEIDFTLPDLYNYLDRHATRRRWSKGDLVKSKRYSTFGREEEIDVFLYREVKKIAGTYLKRQDISVFDHIGLFDQRVGLTYNNAFGLIQAIEKELSIKINNYTGISRADMYSAYNLTKLVQRYA